MEEDKMESLKSRVKATLDKLRPYLQADGGDIKLVEITDDFIVKVKLEGACHGCPFSMQTMKEVPDITGVAAV